MKKLTALILSLVLIVMAFSGCAAENKALLADMSESMQMNQYHEFGSSDYRLNLKALKDTGVINYFMINTNHEKLDALLKQYPELYLHLEYKSDVDRTNLTKLRATADYRVVLGIFGKIYRSDTLTVKMDDKGAYFSKNTVLFVAEVVNGVAEQLLTAEEKANFDINYKRSLASFKKEAKDFIVVKYDNANSGLIVGQSFSQVDNDKLALTFFEQLAKIDVDLPITVTGNQYQVKLTVEQVADLVPKIMDKLEQVDLGSGFEEEQKEIKAMAESWKTDREENILGLNMMKTMFKGSEVEFKHYANKTDEKYYATNMDMKLVYQGKEVMTSKEYKKRSKLLLEEISLPAADKQIDVETIFEKMY